MTREQALLAERISQRLGRGDRSSMQRRVFLKLGGLSGLAIGWACSSESPAGPGMNDVAGSGSGASGGAGGTGSTSDGDPKATPSAGAGGKEQGQPCESPSGAEVVQYEVNAYVHVGADDVITFFVGQSEMGQGVLTALPMLIAEELDADWSKVRSAHPIPDQQRYGNWFTAGSASVRDSFTNLRRVGAAARQMLLAAAAQRLTVNAAELRTSLGVIYHDASDRSVTYAEVAELAGTLPAPDLQSVQLKNDSEFVIIGTPRAQLSARQKAAGTAQYTLDVKVENMLVGVVARSPTFGGTVASYDDVAARLVPGVRDVVQIPSGVAVLADHYWAALKGREALVVQWNAGDNAQLSTTTLRSDMLGQMGMGDNSLNQGDPDEVIGQAAQSLEVVYEMPYLAHAPMEPLNAVADVRDGSVEIWAGTQAPNSVVMQAAQAAGVAAANVTVHVPLLGGGFGRRATNDYVLDAVNASREAGRPVKIVYTREDDMTSGFYRPINANRMRGSLDAEGFPNAWVHDIVVPGIFGEFFAVEGASTNYPYAMANRRVTWQDPGINVPVFTWRSVGASHNAFSVESFMDELADLGGKDPLEVRLRLLDASTDPVAARHAAVLRDVAERSGWATTAPAGRARGLAIHQTFGSIVAEVAEVSVSPEGQVRVHKVWATVDCGRAVNPLGVAAQTEGGIIFGLSAALYGEIEIENGRVVQDNFDTYRLLRMNEAPEIDVNIIDSGAQITGMGEPAVPPIAPAVCNAIFRLTGQRVRRLPIRLAT